MSTWSLVNYKNENDVLEPRVMPQWFIKMAPLAELARAAVVDGRVKFVTDYHEKIYFHWLDNLRDWNISRQIVWGHSYPRMVQGRGGFDRRRVARRWVGAGPRYL